MRTPVLWPAVVLSILLVSLSAGAQRFPADARKALEQQVAARGGDPRDIRIDPLRLQLSASHELLPFHEMLLAEPLQAVEPVSIMAQGFVKVPALFHQHIVNASILINRRTGLVNSRRWPAAPPSWSEAAAALEALDRLAEKEVPLESRQAWEVSWTALPEPLQQTVYEFLLSLQRAYPWLKMGRESIEKIASLDQIEKIILAQEPSPADLRILEQLGALADLRSVFFAGAELSEFLSRCALAPLVRDATSVPEVTFPTALGDIVVAGTGGQTHSFSAPPLLLIDCGGDDEYTGSYSLADHGTPVSVTVDLAGRDLYRSDREGQGNGSAWTGFSALLDLGEGSDRMEGRMYAFGYSMAGVSLIYDASGDTAYSLDHTGLGAGDFGMALLVDEDGSDTYRALHSSQGCGGLGGIGILADRQGSDHYIAPATPVLIASSQLPKQNFSGSQGFGSGRFGPYMDGHCLAGGVGMLIDGSGDDIYEASVFAQGAGYGFGMGFLVDLGGNDRYDTAWYGVGSAAHQGCGIVLDATGDDRYSASHYMIGGAGVDFSLGILADLEGNDSYQAGNASFGYGLENSMAILLDASGDDRYELANRLGCGAVRNERLNTLRMLWPTFGFFCDLAGTDVYPSERMSNNASWTDPVFSDGAETLLWGVGIDGKP